MAVSTTQLTEAEIYFSSVYEQGVVGNNKGGSLGSAHHNDVPSNLLTHSMSVVLILCSLHLFLYTAKPLPQNSVLFLHPIALKLQ